MSQLHLIALMLAALVLSSLIGLEREWHYHAAGLRTHTLVGLGAAVFMLVSKFGFSDVVHAGTVTLDPSRVAAQVVSGIGFIGAGLIILRSDRVRGLTSAAAIWVTAAVGMACGAGLWVVGAATVAAEYLVAFAYPPLMRRLPRSSLARSLVLVTYHDGRGTLRDVLREFTSQGFVVESLDVHHDGASAGLVKVAMQVRGRGAVEQLAAGVDALDGVVAVRSGEDEVS